MRWVLYFIMALGVTGFAWVAWLAMNPPAPPLPVAMAAPPPVVVHPHVVVLTAARALRAGALLGPDDIASREVDAFVQGVETEIPATRDAMLGGMVRHNLPAGAQLHVDSVLRPRDRGFLAAVLDPGMLAVSIAVDPVSGAAGLIWPGDRVDVVLTQTVENSTQPAAKRISGETMLTGLRVIAIDQQLMQGTIGTEGTEHNVHTVTLEVTSSQAERIAVGARLGRLSLAVHASRADEPPTAAARPPSVTWAGDVSSAFPPDRSNEPLRLYSGPDKTEEMHF
jgi:pilus assembly protein CpaB